MKTIRRSPIARATAWLVTLAMVAPCLMAGRAARAQTQQPLRVIIADIVNKSPGNPNLGITATAAIYNEMVNAGQGRFSVFQNSEVLKEAVSLGIKVPSNPNQPANFSPSDLVRIATNLTADVIVEGQVAAGASRGKSVRVSLATNLREVASKEYINGGYVQTTTAPRPGEPSDPEELINKGVSDAAQDVVRQILGRQIATATVIGIETNMVILNKGVRDGVKIGDDVVILREGVNGKKLEVGRVRVARVYPTDSEAEIINNVGGIRPEDGARVLYQPPVEIVSPTLQKPTGKGAQFNLTAVSSTIAAIGLGVLVAQASRGGQASTTSVTAEAGVLNNAPIVRVRWNDNIFGQGNVQQYKIYREPDFPFGQSAGGGGNGTTTNGGSVPIGVQSSTVHEFLDHGSPFFPYASGLAPLIGAGNGNPVGGGNGNNGTTGGCGTLTIVGTLDTGFRPGSSYHYLVTAIILRQSPSTGGTNGGNGGGGNGGGGGGNGGGGGGNGGGGGGNGGGGGGQGGGSGGFECIETDPSRSGQSTPINPVLLTSPANTTASVNVRQFAPQFTSRNGADVFQVEVSTDRTFSNPSLIFRYPLISSSPNADGVAQTTPNPLDLTQSPELLRDPTFGAFVKSSTCSGSTTGTTTPPVLYYRVGARHDGDTPGPINAITQNASDGDTTFRFVYSQVFSFTPAPLPPCPPGPSRAANLLNKIYAGHSRAEFPVLGVGSTQRGAATLHTTVLTPQQILLGARRKRN